MKSQDKTKISNLDHLKENPKEEKNKKDIQQSSAQKEKKLKYPERKEKVMNFLQQAGSWMLPRAIAKQLSRECNVSERQIYKDRLRIIKSIPKPDVSEVAGKFLISWDFAMLQTGLLMRDPEPSIKAKGIDIYFKSIDVFTRFMESYGFKEKVADEHNVNVKDYVFKIITQKEGEDNVTPKAK